MALSPTYIKKYHIYDVFHNDNNYIVIILPKEISKPNIKLQIGNIYKDFNCRICKHNHLYVYITNEPCEYTNTILIDVNGEKFLVKLNKYPQFKNEIIMSTIVKDEDEYIV
jgi:uncharacterized membrane protein